MLFSPRLDGQQQHCQSVNSLIGIYLFGDRYWFVPTLITLFLFLLGWLYSFGLLELSLLNFFLMKHAAQHVGSEFCKKSLPWRRLDFRNNCVTSTILIPRHVIMYYGARISRLFGWIFISPFVGPPFVVLTRHRFIGFQRYYSF